MKGRFCVGHIPWNKGKHGIYSKEIKQKISRKGSHHSEETKQKIRENMLGEKNPRFGKHCSDITKQKISAVHLGKHLSAEHRKKISEHNARTMMGKHHSDAVKQKLRIAHLGKRHTEECKRKMSELRKGKSNAGAFKKGQVSWMKGRHPSDETIQKMRENNLGKHHSDFTKQKIKDLWKDEDFAKKMFESIHAKPNGLELYLDFILQNYFQDEWKYVGDGQVFVEGLCPDFINVNGKKKIIELFGEHWHEGKQVRYNNTEEGRKKVFSEIGYDTLIIWSRELDNEIKVIEKIRNFMAEEHAKAKTDTQG